MGCCWSLRRPTAAVMSGGVTPSGWSPQEPLAHLYEQQENVDAGASAGFGQQVRPAPPRRRYANGKERRPRRVTGCGCGVSPQLSRQPDYSKPASRYAFPPSPPLSYFSSGTEASGSASFPSLQLNRVSPELLPAQLMVAIQEGGCWWWGGVLDN